MRGHLLGGILVILVSTVVVNAEEATRSSSQFVRANLPGGVSLDVPKGWEFLGPDQKRLVETYAESMLDLTNLPIPRGKASTLLAAIAPANSGLMSITVVLEYRPAATQQDVQQISRQRLTVLDRQNRQDIEAGSSINGLKVLSWDGTSVERVNGYWAIIKRYKYSLPGGAPRKTETVQFFLGDRAISVMFLNGERTFVPATPIFERVKSSIALKSNQTE